MSERLRHDPAAALSLERLSALVEAYGGDVERMPEAERAEVRVLLARSEAARRLCDEARALDELLSESALPVPSAALTRALAEIPARHRQEGSVIRLLPFRSRNWAALAAAAAVLLGVFSGASSELDSSDGASESAETSSGDAESRELDELSSLALGAQLATDFASLEGDAQ